MLHHAAKYFPLFSMAVIACRKLHATRPRHDDRRIATLLVTQSPSTLVRHVASCCIGRP
jgi:hypothetical protein